MTSRPLEADDHVGTEPSAIPFDRHLLQVVAVLGHPRQLDHAMERDLSPAPPHLGRPQRGDEVVGLALELGAPRREHLQLLLDAAVGLLPLHLVLPDLVFVSPERVGERTDEAVHRLLARLQLGRQRLLGELKECRVAVAQGVNAERLERLAEPGLGVVEEAALLFDVLTRRRPARLGLRPLRLLGGQRGAEIARLELALAELLLELVGDGLGRGERSRGPDRRRARPSARERGP